MNYNTHFLSASGYLINFNSASNFKDSNKNSIIEEYGSRIKQEITNGKAIDNPDLLNKFVLITYAVSIHLICLLICGYYRHYFEH